MSVLFPVDNGTNMCFNRRMTFADLLSKLRNEDVSLVAKATGVPYETIRRIVAGNTPNPRVKTVDRLASYFDSVPPTPAP